MSEGRTFTINALSGTVAAIMAALILSVMGWLLVQIKEYIKIIDTVPEIKKTVEGLVLKIEEGSYGSVGDGKGLEALQKDLKSLNTRLTQNSRELEELRSRKTESDAMKPEADVSLLNSDSSTGVGWRTDTAAGVAR